MQFWFPCSLPETWLTSPSVACDGQRVQYPGMLDSLGFSGVSCRFLECADHTVACRLLGPLRSVVELAPAAPPVHLDLRHKRYPPPLIGRLKSQWGCTPTATSAGSNCPPWLVMV
jgi:hypothetical protein